MMKHLKKHSLLLVKVKEYTETFDSIFKSVIRLEDNSSLIQTYKNMRPSIIFLNCDNDPLNSIDLIQEIRKSDKQTYIIVFTQKIHKKDLLRVIPLHIFDCITSPISASKIHYLLKRLNKTMDPININNNCILLKDRYKYDLTIKKLYTSNNTEIHLTHKEIIFLDLLVATKGHYLSTENLTYALWEDESLESDCTGRLKALLNGLRKKLPDNCIENQYGLGYYLVFS